MTGVQKQLQIWIQLQNELRLTFLSQSLSVLNFVEETRALTAMMFFQSVVIAVWFGLTASRFATQVGTV